MPVLLPYTYLGPVYYYKTVLEYREIVLEEHENFPKQTYRNRCTIYGANGALNLIVPTEHVSGERTMSLRRIAYTEEWQKLHWKSLETAYRSSPYFEYYEDDLRPILMEKYEFLIELNRALIDWACKALDLEIEITDTESYEVEFTGLDLREAYTPRTSPVGGKDFKRYPQVFENQHGFIPNLSIVDLIFNQGPNAKEYL